MRRFIQLLQIGLAFSQTHRVHAAADIHADYVGDGLVGDRHGGADRAALAGVHVGHDADLTSFGQGVVTHSADLLDRFVLNDLGVADRGINFSFDFKHGFYLI